MRVTLVLKDGSNNPIANSNILIFPGDATDTTDTSPQLLDSGLTNAAGLYTTIDLQPGMVFAFTETSGQINSGTFFTSLLAGPPVNQTIVLTPTAKSAKYPGASSGAPLPATAYGQWVIEHTQWQQQSAGNPINLAQGTFQAAGGSAPLSDNALGLTWNPGGTITTLGTLSATIPDDIANDAVNKYIIECDIDFYPSGAPNPTVDTLIQAVPQLLTSLGAQIPLAYNTYDAPYQSHALVASTGEWSGAGATIITVPVNASTIAPFGVQVVLYDWNAGIPQTISGLYVTVGLKLYAAHGPIA